MNRLRYRWKTNAVMYPRKPVKFHNRKVLNTSQPETLQVSHSHVVYSLFHFDSRMTIPRFYLDKKQVLKHQRGDADR